MSARHGHTASGHKAVHYVITGSHDAHLAVLHHEPLWDQFAALLPERVDSHPLGCHRRRIPDRTLRRRRDEWTALGVMQQLWHLALAAYDRMIGLKLSDLAIDGCITKAPCGGEVAGRSPMDRGKLDLKRSMITDARGIPLGVRMSPFPELRTVHLDRGYDYQVVREVLAERGLLGQIAQRGVPAPIQLGRRWVIERTHAWGNTFGKRAAAPSGAGSCRCYGTRRRGGAEFCAWQPACLHL